MVGVGVRVCGRGDGEIRAESLDEFGGEGVVVSFREWVVGVVAGRFWGLAVAVPGKG